MWLWRPSEHKNLLFALLLLISIIAHVILGIMLFIVYQGNSTSFHVTVGASSGHRPILFTSPKRPKERSSAMNSKHPGSTKKVHGARASIQTGKNGNLDEHTVTRPQLGSQTTFIKDIKNTTTNKHDQKNSQSSSKKQSIQKNKAKNQPIITKKTNQNSKQSSPKKLEHMQPQISNKKISVPVQPTQENITHEILKEPDREIIKESNISQDAHAEAAQESIEDRLQELEGDENDLEGADDVEGEFISAEVARMQEVIEKELVAHWKPPKGLPKDLECQIKARLGGQGKVVSCSIEKKSGVLIYDMAARTAARAMELPRWAWGKEFIIAFKQ